MRLAYLVDVHDRFAAIAEALDANGDVDVLVIGGDITTGGTADRAGEAIDGWRALVPRLLAVAGNMDSPATDARLHELGVSLDRRGVVVGEVGIFGVSAVKGANIGVAGSGRAGWEDRRHGLLLPLSRRPGSARRARS